MKLALRAQSLGKRYRLGTSGDRPTDRRPITHLLTAPLRNLDRLRRLAAFRAEDEEDVLWALRDVSFQVEHGEVLGIIGRNGAGKSTLLKILSRITSPSTGEVAIAGRVGSLLEVGTGFHHELTGRENIFLNGSILGMDRAYIQSRFEEIVDFSGVARFIDTPVKRYSSGMYLRLAFAVAAHLEPEILIVDEVLAVGDAEFQKKCIGKMSDVANEGRTVIFVSHTLDAVQRLCSRCLYLEQGRLIDDGKPAQIISRYLSRTASANARTSPNVWMDLSARERIGSGEARVIAARYSSHNEEAANHPYPLGPLDVELHIESESEQTVASVAMMIGSQAGIKLVNADTVVNGQILQLRRGENFLKVRLTELPLNPGIYLVGFWIAPTTEGYPVYDLLESAFEMEVFPDPAQTLGKTPGSNGLVAAKFEVTQPSTTPGADIPEPASFGG
jgi:lipopolysaccharide transport system ATP-binding protein